MECNFFTCLENHLTIGFSGKTNLNALVQLRIIMSYICETKGKVDYFDL